MNIESSKYKGLTDEEVNQKREKDGYNELPSSKSNRFGELHWGY